MPTSDETVLAIGRNWGMEPATAVTAPPTRGVIVTDVDFAVPTHATIGPRFASWKEAVAHARGTIQRFEYRGGVIRKDSPDYHPRRHFQEEDTLVVYSRAFVQMRIVEPIQDRRGSEVQSGKDGVALSWEVFQDGTVEQMPENRA
jgi:hypothetical protein